MNFTPGQRVRYAYEPDPRTPHRGFFQHSRAGLQGFIEGPGRDGGSIPDAWLYWVRWNNGFHSEHYEFNLRPIGPTIHDDWR